MRRLAAVPCLLVLVACLSGCGGASSPKLDALTLGAPREAPSVTTSSTEPSASTPRESKLKPQLKNVADSYVSKAIPGNVAYKIGPQDLIEISVFKVPDLNKTAQVSEAGTINVPLIGDVSAGGLTSRELEMVLVKRWGDKYLRDPQVSVLIKEFNSQRVTVDGAVKKPGVVQLKGEMTLLQAIANAQGLEPTAESEVLVFRDVKGQRQVARFNLDDIRGGSSKDPSLLANDVVVVGTSAAKEMFNNFAKIAPIARLFVGI